MFGEHVRRIFAGKGYRPVVEGLLDEEQFPIPPTLFEIGKFGGWDTVNDEFFDPAEGSIAEIFESQGKSTVSD